jgi:hypothetical protein
MRNLIGERSLFVSEGESLDQILHLGAGQHHDRSEYVSLHYRKLILVEGEPEAADALSAAYDGNPSVQVIQKIITPKGGDVRFYRYNLSSVNGLLPSGSLNSIYPRLKVIGEETIPSLPLASLIEGLEIDARKKNLLILDLPGQEASLIESLTKDHLRKFEFLIVRGCRASLQEGAKSLQETQALCEKSNYKIIQQDHEDDPNWPIILLRYDDTIAKIEGELENRARLLVNKATQIHQQGERIAELERVVGEVQYQLEQSIAQQTTLQERINDLKYQVSSKETLLDVMSKGRIQQDRIYEELSEERDKLQKQIETLKARVNELEQMIQERDGKSLLIDAEFKKVEGQMEIIKDIFLNGNALK